MTIRDDTAKQIREIRRILRGNDQEAGDTLKNRPLWPYITGILAFLVALALISGCAYGYTTDQAVKAVIGEAEGEGQKGMDAVACAISNRHSLSGVYGLHSKRVINHQYTALTYNKVLKAVLRAKSAYYCSELVHGATFWEGTAFKTPYWAKNMTVTAVIGGQRFYRQL